VRERYVTKDEEQKEFELMSENSEAIKAYREIPYALLREEASSNFDMIQQEFNEICKYYKIYKRGKEFIPEGSNGDYVPAKMKYKMAYSLINKEARFLFANQPDIVINPKGDVGTDLVDNKEVLTNMNDLIHTVLTKNSFSNILLKAARDCFIGKRVACVVNFNEDTGVTITFLKSLQFIYELLPNSNGVLSKFVSFTVIKDSLSLTDKRIFKKRFERDEETGKVYIEEYIYDGAARLVETVTERQELKLGFIPAVVIVNDGLSNELYGESEVELLMDTELWYTKLSNADNDALRKSMNPTKFVVDMIPTSTKNLSTAAGAFWDLGSDQNLEQPRTQVGMLEPQMHYSEALKTTLDRMKTSGYELLDIPNITNDTLAGIITTGKALKAIYWPLIVRCTEKMSVWAPALQRLADIIIGGAIAYPNCVKAYILENIKDIPYEVDVASNTPLPEDEQEEKTMDLAEVESQTMSKKSYMKKWRGLTDEEVNEEITQIAYERQVLEDSFGTGFNNGFNGDNSVSNSLKNDNDFSRAGDNSLNKDGTQGASNQGSGMAASGNKPLNGAQVASLINIMNQYNSGILTKPQALLLIMSMGFDEATASKILEENKNGG
jgi:hypothetical protein